MSVTMSVRAASAAPVRLVRLASWTLTLATARRVLAQLRHDPRTVVMMLAVPAVLMILLTEVIGLYLAAMLYLTLYIRLAGGHSWRTSLLIGIPVPLASYVIFDKFFLIPMPMGWYGAEILRF